MKNEFKLDLSNLKDLVSFLIPIVETQKIILLRGDLGSGKTTLVKTYTNFFYPQENVTSPTFTLMHQYNNIFHYDLYNRSLQEVLELGLLDFLEEDGVHFIEWGDENLNQLLKDNGYNTCSVEILKEGENRIYRIFNE